MSRSLVAKPDRALAYDPIRSRQHGIGPTAVRATVADGERRSAAMSRVGGLLEQLSGRAWGRLVR
jgi:hypothetical protein